MREKDGRRRYWKQVRDLADEHEVTYSEARSLWKRFYKKGGIRRLLLMLTPNRTIATICPYCRDELPVFHDHEDACYQCGTFMHPEPGGIECAPEPKWTCPRCSTEMHEECYQELATCTTLGCSGRANRRHQAIDVDVTPRVYTESPTYYIRGQLQAVVFAIILIAGLLAIGRLLGLVLGF